VRLLSFLSAAALSGETVAPSIAPVRRAAIRACSSGSVFSVIASIYGWPFFQKFWLATYSTRSFGLNPTILYGPVPIAFRLTLIMS
jgi:TRAP-type C4-dicarboxylate transport system permease small subunit